MSGQQWKTWFFYFEVVNLFNILNLTIKLARVILCVGYFFLLSSPRIWGVWVWLVCQPSSGEQQPRHAAKLCQGLWVSKCLGKLYNNETNKTSRRAKPGCSSSKKKTSRICWNKKKKLRAYKFPVSVGVPHYASRTFFWSNLNTTPLRSTVDPTLRLYIYIYIYIYLSASFESVGFWSLYCLLFWCSGSSSTNSNSYDNQPSKCKVCIALYLPS